MNAYIVSGYRTAVGKANKGGFRFTRPDDLAAAVIKKIMADIPNLEADRIDDVIVGNAMPEAEQGLNMGRLISLMGLDTVKVPGVTVNRYCASGLETIAIAAAKIHAGLADVVLAGGAESMSYIPMGGFKVTPNFGLTKEHADYYNNMGLTAEAVANEFNVSREDQDEFAYNSHMKALAGIESGRLQEGVVPVDVEEVFLNGKGKRDTKTYTVGVDEGPRKGTNLEALAKLTTSICTGR